ncbi:MAG: phosphatase PAP2 family protein [Acidobacteriota bacterium]|nr:phosphatase PAP2 family protein [Acidobacteriota bacterium]
MKLFASAFSIALLTCASLSIAQTASLPDAPRPQSVPPPVTVRDTPRNILRDQAAIWTSPLKLRDSNAAGPILLVLGTTLAITTDHEAMTSVVTQDPNLNNRADQASQALVGSLVGAHAVLFAVGSMRHNDHARETGILGAEAVIDSLAVGEVGKLITRRERPDVDGSRGKWFQSGAGFNSSFPSEHSLVAWSSAAVLAGEYRGFWKDTAIYGMATGVSISRVMARQHFPSDVLVGSALGWMIGRWVVHHRRHHIPEETY